MFYILYEKILAESQRLDSQIKSIQAQLKSYPNCNFFCTKNRNTYKWYQSIDGKPLYIPKKERKLAEQLALKKYLTCLLQDLQQEQTALTFYLRHHSTKPRKSEQLLTNCPEYQNLLSSYFSPLSPDFSEWSSADYYRNPKFPEQCIHKSPSGNMVRSKSENIIDTFLYINRIPFRYECSLILGRKELFPDFTILHPETGNVYYWEHFGMISDPDYCKNAISKLQLYSSHGIIPSIQLITTYETANQPLSAELVEKIIKHYFL